MSNNLNQEPKNKLLIWALQGEKRGDFNQVYALARALSDNVEIKQLNGKYIHDELLQPPWPDLSISAGYWTEKNALWIKYNSMGKTKCIHLGRSKVALKHWDLIITSAQYCLPTTSNIFHNKLPIHSLSWQQLSAHADKWRSQFCNLTSPKFVLLLGGSTLGFSYTPSFARMLAASINKRLSKINGSLLVSSSYRTPIPFLQFLLQELKIPYFVYTWNKNEANNPYLGFLALGDSFLIMGDSITMLSEVTFVNKPIYIIYPRGYLLWKNSRIALGRMLLNIGSLCVFRKNRYKYINLHNYLINQGLAVYWDENFELMDRIASTVPNPLEQAVVRVRELFGM